jgi:Putative zinc-RING and/or ribbon
VCSAQQVGSFSRQMRPQKKADLFAYSSSMKSQNLRVKEAMDCPGLDRTLRDIQQYLRSIFLLVENIDNRAFSTEDDQNLPRDRCAEGSDDRDLVASLGKLIGSLLTSPDHEEKNQIRPTHAVVADLLPSSTTAPASAPLRMARKPSDAPASAPSAQEKVSFRSRYKACWRPYLTSGLKMRLNLCDDQGGRLSMKSDEELLRAQGGKCVGCGEPISAQWGFLGLDRNYQPCRLYGGLFCRKWCHGNDRRQIPHRLLLHWDHRAHRVSKQAARFLDMLWSQPVLMISSANPLLYEGVPALRLTRNMRGRVVQLIKRVLKSDTCPEKSDVRDVIMAVLGAEQAHLCLSKELYSIADLVGVQNGDLLASLEALIGMLRDMDRTLGVA